MLDAYATKMRKRIALIAFTLAGLAAAIVYAFNRDDEVAAPVPVRLMITGSDGQRFSGAYTADGVTNTVSAVAPAIFCLNGSQVSFEFKREGDEPAKGEFRVDLYANNVQRTSTTSDTRQGVRGSFRNTSTTNSVWAAGF